MLAWAHWCSRLSDLDIVASIVVFNATLWQNGKYFSTWQYSFPLALCYEKDPLHGEIMVPHSPSIHNFWNWSKLFSLTTLIASLAKLSHEERERKRENAMKATCWESSSQSSNQFGRSSPRKLSEAASSFVTHGAIKLDVSSWRP